MSSEENLKNVPVSIGLYKTQIEITAESWETFQTLSIADYLIFTELIKTTYTEFVTSKS